MHFIDLDSHVKIELLQEGIAFGKNYLFAGEGWLQQMRDLECHIKEYLPDISDDELYGLMFQAESIYCRIMNIQRELFGMVTVDRPVEKSFS